MRSILAQPQTSLCLWSHHRWKMLLPGGGVCKLASHHLATDYPPFDSSFDGFHASFRRFVGLNRRRGEFSDEGGRTHFRPNILIWVQHASDWFTSTFFPDRGRNDGSFFLLPFSSSTCKFTDVTFKQSTRLPSCSKQSSASGWAPHFKQRRSSPFSVRRNEDSVWNANLARRWKVSEILGANFKYYLVKEPAEKSCKEERRWKNILSTKHYTTSISKDAPQCWTKTVARATQFFKKGLIKQSFFFKKRK